MAVTRKVYRNMALDLHHQLNTIDPRNLAMLNGFWIAVHAMELSLKEDNPRFNMDTFREWITKGGKYAS